MPANKPWSYETTQDKLRVFVSSRLQECREERTIVRKAIVSLNHQPVLFEHLGAHPSQPRDLYLSRLRDSQAMVAIYRSGYGYIDTTNGMTISGLEDEFRFAQEQGIDALFYVARDTNDRDPRLAAMIQEAGKRHTLYFYGPPEELMDRVRDDLTALVTSRFLKAEEVQRGVLQETSSELLAQSRRRNGLMVKRGALVGELARRLREAHALCVVGPPGIGKTTLVAQFAEAEGASFVRVDGLAPKDLFSVCAAAVAPSDVELSTYSTLESARRGFVSAWAEAERILLVLDECEFIDEIAAAVAAAGGVDANKRMIVTSREGVNSYEAFKMPPLSAAEARQILEASAPAMAADASLLSSGNPLALQRAIARAELAPLISGSGDSAGRELLAYLSLSDVPLPAEALLELLGNDCYSIEHLYADLGQLGRIVDDSPRGFRLMHAETAAKQRGELAETPQRLRFYVNRLVRLFEDAGDLRMAYMAASIPNDGSEERYAVAALHQATQLGDWRLGTGIADRLLAQALDAERKVEAFEMMLSLVYPLELMGDAARASELLRKARSRAEEIGARALRAVKEAELASRARRTLSVADIEGLQAIYADYGETDRRWDQARLGIELSALYIAAKAYDCAVEILRPALATFKEFGDDYGVDVAERNLAVSLSFVPGNEEEIEALVRNVTARAGENVDTRRQRAWLCNILVLKYRRSGRCEEAEALAKEAIGIGEVLGDEKLRAINLVCLGNVYSDQDRASEAIEAYAAAGLSAQKCARRDIEADASRLQASVLNNLPDNVPGFADRHERAQIFAEHAVGLLAGSIYLEARARALLELGHARQALHQAATASRVYFEAAAEFSKVPDEVCAARSLLIASHLALPDHVEIYLDGLAAALRVAKTTGDTLADRFIELVGPVVERSPLGALVPLLGAHLQHVRSKLPPMLRPALAEAVINVIKLGENDKAVRKPSFRLLHAGLVLAFLLKDDPRPFLLAKLAETITQNMDGLDARELGDGQWLWTVVLELDRPVTVTFEPIDETPATALAAFGLSLFVKAFEGELRDKLVALPMIDELLVQVWSYEAMPADFRETADRTIGTDKILAEQSCAVTRPTSFVEGTPTFVVLAPRFLEEVMFGEGIGGSLHLLFGLTLVELVFQLLRGEVDIDEIRPKVVSLVRKTLS